MLFSDLLRPGHVTSRVGKPAVQEVNAIAYEDELTPLARLSNNKEFWMQISFVIEGKNTKE